MANSAEKKVRIPERYHSEAVLAVLPLAINKLAFQQQSLSSDSIKPFETDLKMARVPMDENALQSLAFLKGKHKLTDQSIFTAAAIEVTENQSLYGITQDKEGNNEAC